MQKVNVFLLTSAKIKIITNLFLCRYVLQVLGNIYTKFYEVLRSSFYFIDVCLGPTFILYFLVGLCVLVCKIHVSNKIQNGKHRFFVTLVI